MFQEAYNYLTILEARMSAILLLKAEQCGHCAKDQTPLIGGISGKNRFARRSLRMIEIGLIYDTIAFLSRNGNIFVASLATIPTVKTLRFHPAASRHRRASQGLELLYTLSLSGKRARAGYGRAAIYGQIVDDIATKGRHR
ncbi:hypothetical protein [Nioella nitratireducens]|uniref:hypothetical protein n=1 Tax=Nioella nitratireducens TaxID=1287720 RepID=UPI0011BA9925|nr:hypothetical protein [Nioella nitratireducens]